MSNKFILTKLTIYFSLLVFLIITGCENSLVTETMDEDTYLTSEAINSTYSSNGDDDDNLFSSEVTDFESDGAVDDGSPSTTNKEYDSLSKYGRIVTGVNINTSITNSGDTIKSVAVTRTITGYYIVVGYIDGVQDSVSKPYTQEQKRNVTFRRIANTENPRKNWRVYQLSAVDGKTLTPQDGKSNIVITKVEIYRNDELIDTLIGTDFTSKIYMTKYFGGDGVIKAYNGDNIKTRVYLNSNQNDTDIVAFHWARNGFGFHREKFSLISETANGSTFDRVYEKTFTIYNEHKKGIFNGFISANTSSSINDNDLTLFSSTYLGFPYRIKE